jgi:hypothetical protein
MPNRKIDKTMPVRRDPFAASLRNFRSVRFDHKNTERGGARNEHNDYMDEYENENIQEDILPDSKQS